MEQRASMKTIGILGGMSWESTQVYYQLLNRSVRAALGGLHSAKVNMVSVDFADIARLQHDGDWDATARLLSDYAAQLDAAGTQVGLIATNTMHKVYAPLCDAVSFPWVHIVDPTAAAIRAQGLSKVGLLGTAFTMAPGFYRERMREQGIEMVVPNEEDQQQVHRIIYQELCQGQIVERSRAIYQEVIQRLGDAGAQGTIAGCTEIGMLVSAAQAGMPWFDSTALHAQAAVDIALA